MADKGGQLGNNNAGRGQQARHALEMAIATKGKAKKVISSMQVLYEIWRIQVDKALEGDQAATNAIMDRLDGKPRQSIDIADITDARAQELTDEQLTDIATGSSEGATES